MNINILGMKHKIKNCDVIDNNVTTMGQVDLFNQIIKIKNEMGKEVKQQTLMHEIIHAVLFNLGYNDEYTNEKFVQQLSLGIYQLIKDNDINKIMNSFK